jgi:hypothetical protein
MEQKECISPRSQKKLETTINNISKIEKESKMEVNMFPSFFFLEELEIFQFLCISGHLDQPKETKTSDQVTIALKEPTAEFEDDITSQFERIREEILISELLCKE